MRVLIADDHALFRGGLRRIIEDVVEQPTFLEAASYQEAAQALQQDRDIELLLLDLGMPGMSGADQVAALCDTAPDVLVAVVSGSENRSDVLDAINAGAVGFIPKSSSPKVMLAALRLILSGGVYLPTTLIEKRRSAPAPATGGASAPGALTPRQMDVLALLVRGASNKEIARQLHLSVSGVKLHVAGILETLQVQNRTEATNVALSRGLIQRPA